VSIPPAPGADARAWTFLTNHALVLLCLAADPAALMKDVAARVGITERGVQRIVAELATAGFLAVKRVGRRNAYEVRDASSLGHPVVAHRAVRHLLDLGLGGRPQGR
jgi:hypothetical protein